MEHIFVTLPSNASKDFFPNNKQGEFTVKLANSIDLTKYEVGLADLQYPNSWLTIKDCYVKIRKDGSEYTGVLQDARYSEMDQLIEAVQKLVDNYHVQRRLCVIHYDRFTMHTSIELKSDDLGLQFSPQLASILGFKDNAWLSKGVHFSDRESDLDNGMTAFYIYTDIIQNQMVGDVLAPLLRVIPLRGSRKFSVYRAHEFKDIRYLPAIASQTELIKIVIRRDDGGEIPFTTGKVIVTLALRRKSQ